MSSLLLVDFNDQYHAIKRLWGNRSLNVKALLKLFPDPTIKIGVAKAPNGNVVDRFDQMLRHNGFRCEYIIGAPSWQTCTALLISQMVKQIVLFGNMRMNVTVVSGSPDAHYVREVALALGAECRVVGFSDLDWIAGLPATVLTPVPMSHVIGVDDVIKFEHH